MSYFTDDGHHERELDRTMTRISGFLSQNASAEPAPNPTITTILHRHSTRQWAPDQTIAEPVLAQIARCGAHAPSSKSAQPWRFHIVTDRGLLGDLALEVQSSEGAGSYVPLSPETGQPRSDWQSTVAESAGVLRHATAAIFVENRAPFSDGRRATIEAIRAGRIGSLVAYTLEVLGLGAAIQNMWLAAEALGVQGCFMGDVLIAEEAICARLGIEGDLTGVLALGRRGVPLQQTQHEKLSGEASRGEDGNLVWHRPTPS